MMGFTGTVDTLCGQAWGAKNYRAFGLVVQVRSRSWVCVCWMQEWCRVLGKAHAGRTVHTSLAGSTAPCCACSPHVCCFGYLSRGCSQCTCSPQRALLVNTVFSLIIMALWLKSETLFLALGQVGAHMGGR